MTPNQKENALPRTVSLREQVKAERQEAVDWVNEHSHMAVLTEEGRFRGASIVLYDHFLELIDAQEAAEKNRLADKLQSRLSSLIKAHEGKADEFTKGFVQGIRRAKGIHLDLTLGPMTPEEAAELSQNPSEEGADSSDKGTKPNSFNCPLNRNPEHDYHTCPVCGPSEKQPEESPTGQSK